MSSNNGFCKGAKALYFYGELFRRIYKLGFEVEHKKKGLFYTFYVLSIAFFVLYIFCSFNSKSTVYFVLSIFFAALSVITLIVLFIYAYKSRKNIDFDEAIEKRKTYIELILLKYLKSPSRFYLDKIPPENVENMRTQVSKLKPTINLSPHDFDLLIEKMSDEKKTLETKRRTTGILLFAAAIFSAGMDVTQAISTYFLWNSFPVENDEALKTLISMLSISFALFIFVALILLYDLVKSPIFDLELGVLIRNDHHLRNIEYTILTLKELKNELNMQDTSTIESTVEMSFSSNEENEFDLAQYRQNKIIDRINKSLSKIERELRVLNKDQIHKRR